MKTVLLRGPFTCQSGYSTHARQCARWLLNKPNLNCKFILTPWGSTSWELRRDAHDGLIGKIMDRSCGPEEKCDISVQVQLPNEFSNLAPINIGITASVETDKCNISWIECCNKMTHVVVPSKHAATSLTNTGAITVPLHVIPESFADACGHDIHTLPLNIPPFSFLVFGQLTGNNAQNDRKNTFNTIKWLCEVFAGNKDVGIVLKTNLGRSSKIDKMQTVNLVKSVLKEVRKGEFPKLTLLHGDMTDEEVAGLYRHPDIKALISLTRGEGYGLPTCEAAASGLPIIATGWSGHLDFLNLGKWISVNYNLVPIHQSRVDNVIFMKDARWSDALESDAKMKLQKFYQKPSIPQEWAKDLQLKVREKLSFDKVCEKYEAELGALFT